MLTFALVSVSYFFNASFMTLMLFKDSSIPSCVFRYSSVVKNLVVCVFGSLFVPKNLFIMAGLGINRFCFDSATKNESMLTHTGSWISLCSDILYPRIVKSMASWGVDALNSIVFVLSSSEISDSSLAYKFGKGNALETFANTRGMRREAAERISWMLLSKACAPVKVKLRIPWVDAPAAAEIALLVDSMYCFLIPL